MRILHVVEVSHGGVVSYVREVGREQARRGHEVHLLAPRGVFDLAEAHSHVWSVNRRRPTGFPGAVRRLRRLAAQTRPDIVHLHSFFPGMLGRFPGIPGHAAAMRTETGGPLLIYQPHAWAFHAVRKPWSRAAVELWERLAARHTHAIACVSAEEAEEGRRRGIRAQAQTVGLPVDVSRFRPVDDVVKEKWRARLGVREPRLLVCVGRLCRQKGQDRLLDAWARAPVPRTELVLVGPGDPGPLARRAAGQWGRTVRAVGAQDDVRPWLWAADLAVVASRYEGSTLATGEALACGRAVVTTDVGGARHSVGAAEVEAAGCIVAQDRVPALLDECRRRLESPALLDRESRNARRRAERLFDIAAVADRLDELYEHGNIARSTPTAWSR
jgi:glycosyltransferase involved in cell wall biosynthesis